MTVVADPAAAKGAKPINLALQGGGAHGAFTWGVLDRFLADSRIAIEAISGTSAGAINAVVLADGLMRGGPEGARERLKLLWDEIGRAARLSPIQRGPLSVLSGDWSLDSSLGYLFFDAFTRSASPYDFNPLDINPLRDIVGRLVDFDLVRSCGAPKLFVSATNVQTGRVRVFGCPELSLDAVMASACLPTLFKAVEVDGQYYWDGGYTGNPALFPFFYASRSNDILIVQINPLERKEVPRTAHEIMNRINEISFNASLLSELRSVDFVRRMLDEGRLDPERYRRLNIHIIGEQQAAAAYGASSKFNIERAFLQHLFEIGQKAAADWLELNFDAIGERSTVDIRRMFAGDGYDEAAGVV
ncbi:MULTISPECIES: patatin-like phospholipase family protein [Rhodomicrobium]|uniref:patatin-like phospholipase family protein n=1 Tax=Rhodomicrobium TaxID=1068 RepID=UPI000B4A61FC|nr:MULTISPECIES: patatin-like phospholipase family protein [Rhodomicrobium]